MSDADVKPMERHKTLYFMDGNIVLLAPWPDQPALLFCVHKSVLSSHSTIFSDMFDICNQSDTTSTSQADHFYDGMPLIHMPDNANHLESILKILYYQSTLPWTPYSPNYPRLVTPMLELSRKYGIDRMRDQIVGNLESDWPRTLQQWDKLEREIQCMANDSGAPRIDDHFPEPASAIRVAHQFDIPSILPAAFYHLSRLSVLDDWDKARADSSQHVQNPTKRTVRWGLLSATDFHCLLLGKAEFAKVLRGCLEGEELRHVYYNGWENMECNAGERMWKDICDKCAQSTDPLALLKNQSGPELDDDRCCSTCRGEIMARIPQVRAQIWERLGEVYHLKHE